MKVHKSIPLNHGYYFPYSEENIYNSYFKIAVLNKYPYKDRERSSYFKSTKNLLALSAVGEVVFSLKEFQDVLEYYIFLIKNISDYSLECLEESLVMNTEEVLHVVHCLVYYYQHYVKDRKKPWSKKDVMNEICFENGLTAKEWDINETRNTGRF